MCLTPLVLREIYVHPVNGYAPSERNNGRSGGILFVARKLCWL